MNLLCINCTDIHKDIWISNFKAQEYSLEISQCYIYSQMFTNYLKDSYFI